MAYPVPTLKRSLPPVGSGGSIQLFAAGGCRGAAGAACRANAAGLHTAAGAGRGAGTLEQHLFRSDVAAVAAGPRSGREG